jgi:cobalamin biosynthesis Co2+ chelatase CbiK
MSENSVVALETFPVGSQVLMDLIGHAHPELTLLQIEHMLSATEYRDVRLSCVEDFFAYIIDTFRAFLASNAHSFSFDHLFCHGSLFESEDIYATFQEAISEEYDNRVRILRFSEILECDADMVVTHGLAEIATELLMVKKDPLVRILRYVLYNYE